MTYVTFVLHYIMRRLCNNMPDASWSVTVVYEFTLDLDCYTVLTVMSFFIVCYIKYCAKWEQNWHIRTAKSLWNQSVRQCLQGGCLDFQCAKHCALLSYHVWEINDGLAVLTGWKKWLDGCGKICGHNAYNICESWYAVAEQCSTTVATHCSTSDMDITRHTSTRGPHPRQLSTL